MVGLMEEGRIEFLDVVRYEVVIGWRIRLSVEINEMVYVVDEWVWEGVLSVEEEGLMGNEGEVLMEWGV